MENTAHIKPPWALTAKKVLRALHTSEHGLTEEEVEKRREEHGLNVIHEEKEVKWIKILAGQFKSPLIFVLVIAGGITLALGDLTDSIFIFAAVLINTALGFYQEYKAEHTLTSLKSYIKERTRVIRKKREMEIDAINVVPGDIIHIRSGNRIPADARIITANNLSVDEAILTGESLVENKHENPCKEDTPIGDRKCMVFGGTAAAFGSATAVVTNTGKSTELGKIASLIQEGEEQTPLQKSISSLALKATGILLALVVGLFITGIALGYETLEMFVTSVAIAVAAVPEGLPIALTVILAVGVERLAKKKGVVRKLLAAETLGRTTVILTDKTGTLTEAKMELTKISGKNPRDIIETALLASEITIENIEDDPSKWSIVGRPLEVAIAKAALEHKVPRKVIAERATTLIQLPFNATDKLSAAKTLVGGKEVWAYLGAPEVLVEKIQVHKSEKEKILREVEQRAGEGARILAVASSEEFMGLLIFKDPIRKEIKETMKDIMNAGVRVVIVTGDHAGTARAIAKEAGINTSEEEVAIGKNMEKWSDDYLTERLDRIKIFARISPEDKLRITRLYQNRGEIVAMTGDGVNDAPALNEADIGIAVGSGTDVAKGAADLVILDDNFKTITTAIHEGRKILGNIKKAIIYLLSNALDELVLIGGTIIISAAFTTNIPIPLTALQILWVNFFSDSLPAIAFAFENTQEPHIHGKVKKLFDRQMKLLILAIGTLTSILLLGVYLGALKLGYNPELVRTFLFAYFAIYALLVVFSIRNLHQPIFTYNPFENRYLTAGVLLGIILVLAAIYLPFLQSTLDTTPLPLTWLAVALGFCLVNLITVELGKALFRKA
jgi:P-type Ca2+ transporter type 2C